MRDSGRICPDNVKAGQPINEWSIAALRPNAQYGLHLTDDQIVLPQPGSLWLARPYDHQSYHKEWSFTTLDGDQTDGAGSRTVPALATTASYTQEFLPDANQSDMGPAAKSEQWDLQQRAAFASCNPADLENTSTDISESMQPSTTSSKGQCECLSCLHFGEYPGPYYFNGDTTACRVPGCVKTFAGFDVDRRPWHERDHFLEDRKYMCNSSGCKRSFKRWDDLVRHTSSRHCLNPKRLPCPEIGCKYSGGNGFVRKDKLKSHYKTHEGKPRFAQRGVPRLVQPAVAAPSTSTLCDESLAEAHGVTSRGYSRSEGNKRVPQDLRVLW